MLDDESIFEGISKNVNELLLRYSFLGNDREFVQINDALNAIKSRLFCSRDELNTLRLRQEAFRTATEALVEKFLSPQGSIVRAFRG